MASQVEQFKDEIRKQAAMENARHLVEVGFDTDSGYTLLTGDKKLNEHCFERCVPKPGSSLSSSENTCFSQCIEKYMSAWDAVSRQYVGKIQAQGAHMM